MSSPRSRTVKITVIILLLLLVLLVLLLTRCKPKPQMAQAPAPTALAPTPVPAVAPPASVTPAPEDTRPATIRAPAQAAAGTKFKVEWSGPNNVGDYLTIVSPDAKLGVYENYTETKHGNPLELTAPMDVGVREIRYVTARSQTILGRTAIEVLPVTATLTAPDEAGFGTNVTVTWTGPNNAGDFVTIVPQGSPDQREGGFAYTKGGASLQVKMPDQAGVMELRYVSGQGHRVLARRPLTVLPPQTSLSAPAEVTAGADFMVEWTGPNNRGDYITIVTRDAPDARYQNYSDVAKGTPLKLTALIEPGPAELRYVSGGESKVLSRRPIQIVAAPVKISAAAQAIAGSLVEVTWEGPNQRGDYITIVTKDTPDNRYAGYNDTVKGSPLKVMAPMAAGAAEVRYVSGQGAKVLARRPLLIEAAKLSLDAPATAALGETISIAWTGPANGGDFLTIVPKGARDADTGEVVYTTTASPHKFKKTLSAGTYEVRYISGQGALILARREIVVQ